MGPRVAVAALTALAAAAPAHAQPATDIHLASLEGAGASLRLTAPRNITDRAGYDNQPHFTPDGRGILYTSIREDGQADTYRYELETGSTVRLTDTPESEYSPTPLPGGSGFSVVRVEADSSQRLWRFDASGGSPTLTLPDIEPVGYHAWIDSETVALFVLGEPPTLQIVDVTTGSARVAAESIGRSLHRIPGGTELAFVRKRDEEEWWIEALDPGTGTTRALVRTRPGSEDFAWTVDGAIVMGQGSRLFVWHPAAGGEWVLIADLEGAGISEITRVAVAPNGRRIALVSRRPE